MDKQTQAVARAMQKTMPLLDEWTHIELAKAAIAASGAEHLPVLVNLIKYADGKCWPEVQAAIDAILPKLPPELRGEPTNEQF